MPAGKPIRIDGEGRWYHGDEEMVHPGVLSRMRSSLRPAPGGGWELAGGRRLEVEDTPRFVTGVLDEGGGVYTLALDGGERERFDPRTLRRDGKGFTALLGGGAIPARFTRTAWVDLGHLLREGPGGRLLLPAAGGDVVIEPEEP